MALKLITPATLLPVTVAEAKLQARLDDDVLDTRVSAYITTATQMAEQITGRAIMPQTWELSLEEFPCEFELTRVPVVSVTSLKYLDFNGVQQILSSDLYTLDAADDFGEACVEPAYGTSWPIARCQSNAVVLRYLAGYADAASVPQSIRDWIILMVSAMVDNPAIESNTQTYSLGFADRMLDRYRVYCA